MRRLIAGLLDGSRVFDPPDPGNNLDQSSLDGPPSRGFWRAGRVIRETLGWDHVMNIHRFQHMLSVGLQIECDGIRVGRCPPWLFLPQSTYRPKSAK